VHPFFTSLENALGNFDNPSGIYETVDASKRNTYIQWNVNYNDWEKFKSLGMDLPPMYVQERSKWDLSRRETRAQNALQAAHSGATRSQIAHLANLARNSVYWRSSLANSVFSSTRSHTSLIPLPSTLARLARK